MQTCNGPSYILVYNDTNSADLEYSMNIIVFLLKTIKCYIKYYMIIYKL